MDEHTNIVRGIARSLENVPYALSARFPQQLNEAADALSQQAEEIRTLREQRDRLLETAKAHLKARNDEAKAAITFENAQNNFSCPSPEGNAYSRAMIAASEADAGLRAAINQVEASK